ncbi:MAG TPA: response regulator [Stellaceae bacterium]|jgi:CheY-like chemotaxis protein|nr:response regulator [Stellaceae bacterium]
MADILIIDDDRQMRRLLTRILEGAGHTVREGENGREGLKRFEEQRPALIITDIVMPDMEGIETIVSLRRDNPDLPIIAISGGSDPVYLRAAASLGATAALQKPFAPQALTELVDGMLATAARGE